MPRFLSVERILQLHGAQLEQFGGRAGVRDSSLLESAVAIPATTFGGQYVHSDLAEMAAVYLFHLSKNHPFVDGNNRTATAAALVLLKINGITFVVSDDQMTGMALAIADGSADKAAAAHFFRRHWPKQNP